MQGHEGGALPFCWNNPVIRRASVQCKTTLGPIAFAEKPGNR